MIIIVIIICSKESWIKIALANSRGEHTSELKGQVQMAIVMRIDWLPIHSAQTQKHTCTHAHKHIQRERSFQRKLVRFEQKVAFEKINHRWPISRSTFKLALQSLVSSLTIICSIPCDLMPIFALNFLLIINPSRVRLPTNERTSEQTFDRCNSQWAQHEWL